MWFGLSGPSEPAVPEAASHWKHSFLLLWDVYPRMVEHQNRKEKRKIHKCKNAHFIDRCSASSAVKHLPIDTSHTIQLCITLSPEMLGLPQRPGLIINPTLGLSAKGYPVPLLLLDSKLKPSGFGPFFSNTGNIVEITGQIGRHMRLSPFPPTLFSLPWIGLYGTREQYVVFGSKKNNSYPWLRVKGVKKVINLLLHHVASTLACF